MKARYILIVLAAIIMVLGMVLGACVAPQAASTATPQAAVPTAAPTAVPPTAAPVVEARPLVTWMQYDQGNEDPKSDERVGNEYLRKSIPLFNQAYEGKWVWENRYTPWDKAEATIITAVQGAGEVPDLMEINSNSVNKFYQNATMQDLTAWAQAQPWWSDMDPNAIKSCTGPDGKLYCIPMAERPFLVYVWKDRFPNGFPKTPEQFLKEGERLKAEGNYAMTFFGSTDFDGDGAVRAVWSTIASFGGAYDDGKGKMLLNTPENIAAITWLREMVQKGYVPEISFAGGFQEEEAFKDSSAGSLPTGLFGYRYINPLTAPSGKKYEKKTQDDMLDAIAAGDVYLAPMPAPEGKKPGCEVSSAAFAIPVGAKNPEAAYDYINWLLTPEQNPAYVLGPGAGFPVLKSLQAGEQYQTPFYQEAGVVVAASACRPFFGSLSDASATKKAVMTVVYKLIKQDPTADIATELQKVQDDFNKQL
jgi:multiple sugar transport system substrate-binding protein